MKINRLLSLLSIAILTSCSSGKNYLDGKVFCFNTIVQSILYEGNNNNITDIKNILLEYDALTDNYAKRDGINNVYTINSSEEAVEVDPKLYNILSKCMEVSQKYELFNPLCGSLAKKWKSALANKQILDEATINEELEKIKNSTLVLGENHTVQIIGEAELDLGAVAKGYANDIIRDYLATSSITKYLINSGVSSVLAGEKNNADGLYNVGLPLVVKREYFKAKNIFISTSGNYEQGVEIEGKIYSHIVNPITGSALNTNDAVVVLSDSGYLGDIYSTLLMMYDIDDIKTFEQEENVKTIVIRGTEIVYHHPDIEVLTH